MKPRIKASPEDFIVEEIPLYPLSDQGHFTYLWIEKRLRNTTEVARDLATSLRLDKKHIGYAGRKDKHAITRQWFSAPNLDPEKAQALQWEGARVLDARRHHERLRPGQLLGNRFRLTVRQVDPKLGLEAEDRFQQVLKRGLPNRFGAQRFGRSGTNAERGADILRRPRFRGDRYRARFFLNALQSAVFNEVLARRPVGIDAWMEGDLAIVHATELLLPIHDVQLEKERLERFEISPTGPMFGTKMRSPKGAAANLEREVMDHFELSEVDLDRLPKGMKLYGERRSLRTPLQEASFSQHDDRIELEFVLQAGSFATVVIEELFPQGFEEGDPLSLRRLEPKEPAKKVKPVVETDSR